MEADNIRQQALMALIKAVERFDPEVGVTFKDLRPTARSRASSSGCLRDKGWSVRPPRSLQELAVQARRLEPELTQGAGAGPAGAGAGRPARGVHRSRPRALSAGASYRADSLDAPIGDGSTTKGAMIAGNDGDMAMVETRLDVEALLEGLDGRERAIIEMRFVERRSQQEIADELGVSQFYLSRLLRKTLATRREQAEE